MVVQCFTMPSSRLHSKTEGTIAIELNVLFVALTQAIYADFQNKISAYIKNTENAKQNLEFYH